MKKKILIHSNNTKALTGFGKHTKNIMRYLQTTKKYEIIEFANGVTWGDEQFQLRPWKAQGSLPNGAGTINELNKNKDRARAAGYGAETIDEAIKTYKPDIYVGIEDIWGFTGYWNKPWWDKINHMIWTTLDSQPILPLAMEAAPKTKNFYVWASFAEKDMIKAGQGHVKTLHGTVNTNDFYRFTTDDKKRLRSHFGLSDEFIVGFVFRNQLRKSVPNLLEGFKIFKKDCPKAKLLLHTHWAEGWDIPRLIEEKGIDNNDILTTYFCSECKNYDIRPFVGQKQNCKYCGAKETVNTTNIRQGVDEEQLNQIYNLMDVYCHPFTSGGMEIPIFEAKLTGLITLVTSYSCGEDSCTSESGSFPLDWSEYREPGTQFIKASTYPSSIAKQLKKVWKMESNKRFQLGKKARQWTIDNYSTEVIGKKLEEILDKMPDIDYDFDWDKEQKNKLDLQKLVDEGKSLAIVMPQSSSDLLWINSMLSNLKELYPQHKIYIFTKPEFYSFIDDNPNVHKVLPYSPQIDNVFLLEGKTDHKGYFDLAFFPHHNVQTSNFFHNGEDKKQFQLCHM
jgi:glycosyltransferase involved in cell wall biosynthesis